MPPLEGPLCGRRREESLQPLRKLFDRVHVRGQAQRQATPHNGVRPFPPTPPDGHRGSSCYPDVPNRYVESLERRLGEAEALLRSFSPSATASRFREGDGRSDGSFSFVTSPPDSVGNFPQSGMDDRLDAYLEEEELSVDKVSRRSHTFGPEARWTSIASGALISSRTESLPRNWIRSPPRQVHQ